MGLLKKVWWFIWEDESVWSWIINVILAFVIIKFIVYPGLGLLLGTTHPIVAVVSGSMEHDGSFDNWWESYAAKEFRQGDLYQQAYNISKEQFKRFDFNDGFNKGDLMVIYSPKRVRQGEVIVFNADHRLDPIIHRVVATSNGDYYTKGDHNPGSSYFEQAIPPEKVIGKAIFRIPFLGWVKITFVEMLKLAGVYPA